MALDTQVVDSEQLIVKHLDLWTSAQTAKSTAGRGSNNKIELTGIKKLRELILELAVRGKLVPQDPNNEPASELLSNILSKKNRLMNEEGLKTSASESISQDDFYLDIPKSWVWGRLGNLAKFIDYRGKTPVKTESGIKLITAKNIRKGYIDELPEEFIDENDYEDWMQRGIPRCGDILFTTEAPLGNAAIIDLDIKFALAQRTICFQWHDLNVSKFMLLQILGQPFQKQLLSNANGMTAKGIKSSKLKEIPVVLPPINEQNLIVSRVAELMLLCDKLEEGTFQSIAAHNQLVDTLLQTLVDSANADELTSNWQRLSEHFDTLFTTEYSIDALKQTILQLAVMGKLVKQDPTDEPASELLKRIANEKEALVKAGKIKKQKPLPPISEDEKPFELPDGWCWAQLDDIGYTSIGLTYSPNDVDDNGTVVLRSSNIQNGKIDLNDLVRVSRKIPKSLIVELGDLLICARNGSKALVGKTAMIKEMNEEMTFGAFMAIFRSELNPYIEVFLKSPVFRHLLEDIDTTTINQITQNNLKGTLLPIPPQKEQDKILAKTEKLMAFCDLLKAKFNQAQTTLLKLTDACIESSIVRQRFVASSERIKENSMNITTNLVLGPTKIFQSDAILAEIIKNEGGEADAKNVWLQSKLDLPVFYNQLKKEIIAGYILKPSAANF